MQLIACSSSISPASNEILVELFEALISWQPVKMSRGKGSTILLPMVMAAVAVAFTEAWVASAVAVASIGV